MLSGNAFTFNNNVTTTGTGPVELTNSGRLTIASGSAFSLDGTFTQNGTGAVSFGGAITTTNDAISFASPILLIASGSLNTGAGIGDITINGTVDGAFILDLTAGTGNVDIQGAVGQITPPSGMTIFSATDVLINANTFHSGPFTIVSATGTTTINGTLDATSININGTIVNFNNAVTSHSGSIGVINSGLFTVASMSPITSATSFSQTGAGSVTLSDGNICNHRLTLALASPITMTQNIVLNSGGGNLTLSSTVGGVFDLTLTAGVGNILLSGNIGTPRIGNFTITSANNITVQAITAKSLTLLSATGTSTLSGGFDTNGINGIALTGNNFLSGASITTTNGGPVVVTNSGLITATGASIITLNGGGSFTQNGTGPVNLGGTITTQNANISHSGPVSVLLPATLTSNNGNIVFQNTIDGPACLTLIAGTGDVTLSGTVGGTTPLGCLNASGDQIFQNAPIQSTGAVQETATTSINVGGDITTTGSAITLTGNVIATVSPTLSTGTGADITVTGTINGDVSGHNFTVESGTGDIDFQGIIGGSTSFTNVTLSGNNVSWEGLGSGIVGSTGVTTINAVADINFTGNHYNNGTQNYTAGGNFNFTAGTPTLVQSNVLPITFNTGTIQLGTTDLSLTTFGGNITFGNLLGTGDNLTVNADVGSLVFTQIGALGDDLNNVTLTANSFTPTPTSNVNVFANNLTINSSIPLSISSDQLTGNVTYNQPVIIQGSITYTCGTSGTITFNGTVDATTAGVDSLAFDFDPCGGSLIFNGPVGSVAPLAFITVNDPIDVTLNNTMAVGYFAVTNGNGTVEINSGLTSTAAQGISLSTLAITIAGSVSTASAGPIILDNSGALTIAAGTTFNSDGPFEQIGAGAVTIGGNVTTQGTSIQLTGPVTLNGTQTFDSHALGGGNISFASTVQGAQNLILNAGGGDISFGVAIGTSGTPLNGIQIISANNVTASAPIFTSTLTQLAGTGLSSFNAVTTGGLNGIQLEGSAFTFNGNVTTTGNGPLFVNNSGTLNLANAVYSISGALTQSGSGSSTLAGAFTVGRAITFAQAVTLSNTTSLDTSANSQNITFDSTITNDLLGPHNLTLNAGAGNISVADAIGATPIGALTITNANNANFNAISAASVTQIAGAGTTTIAGNIATSGLSGISLTGAAFTINGTVTTTGSGPFTIVNSAPLALTLGNSTLISGAFSQSGGGPVFLSGTVATDNQNLVLANAVTLTGPSALSTGAGAGTLTLSSTVDGNQTLSLTAGSGNIVFGANLGSITPVGALIINSVHNITYPQVNAASIAQNASTGTTTITGPFTTTGALGVSITGGAINQNGAITTGSTGPVSFVNTGLLTIGVSVNTVAGGTYSQSGGGSVSLGGSITSTNGDVSLAGPVALTANVAVIAGPINHNISFTHAITGAHALSLTASSGSITFGANVGTVGVPLTSFTITHANNVSTQNVFAGSISQQIGSGTSTFNGSLNATTVTGISLIGTNFIFDGVVTSSGPLVLTTSGLATFNIGATGTIAGALTQNGTGSVQLSNAITAGGAVSFTGAAVASGTASITTQAANQPIRFFNTVDGPGNLTLSSGTAGITFDMSIGSLTPLGAFNIATVGNLIADSINAASLTQSAGTGLSLFNFDVDTSGPSGISLSGNQFTFLGNLLAAGGGGITLTNAGTLTTTIGKMITSDGVFTQNGSGNVFLGSTVMTTNAIAANAAINFSGTSPITLTAPSSIDSSMGGGTINFSAASTVDGNQPITLSAGTGDINILSNFGSVTRLGAVTFVSGHDIQFQAITANSITQLAGSGTTSLLGALDTNTPAGMLFIGNNFTTGPSTASITTTNGGSVTITNQGIVSGGTPVVVTIDGSFIQNGPGIIFTGPITARLGISYTGPAIIQGSGTLDSSGGNGDITFSNVVSGLTGTENLILNAGTGNITLAQPLGVTTTFGAFPVTALGSITATGETISINSVGTSPSPGITGTTTLTASGDVDFTGTTYNANTQVYTASFFDMDAGALTTFSSNGNPLTFQTGAIHLSAGTDLTMNSAGGNIALGVVHAQSGDHRNLVFNAGAGSINVGNIGTQGNGEFASASFTATNLTLRDAFADSFTFNYSGTLNALGDIVSTDTPLTFPNPVVLQGTNIFSTVGSTGGKHHLFKHSEWSNGRYDLDSP